MSPPCWDRKGKISVCPQVQVDENALKSSKCPFLRWLAGIRSLPVQRPAYKYFLVLLSPESDVPSDLELWSLGWLSWTLSTQLVADSTSMYNCTSMYHQLPASTDDLCLYIRTQQWCYVLFDIYFFQISFLTFSCSKKYFSEYCSIFKKSVGLWYPPSMGLPWKI